MTLSNDIRAAYPSKELLGIDKIDDYGFQNVRKLLREIGEALSRGGAYFSAAGVQLDAPAIDSLRISGGSIAGMTPGGYVFTTANGTHKFPNTNLTTYYVYGGWCELISTTETNSRTGKRDRTLWLEAFGYEGTPDSVTDNLDGTITFVVDTLLGAAGPHVGRDVRVRTAAAQLAGAGSGSGVVVWDGANNKITTVVADSLDQVTISVVPADYVVTLIGPRVLDAPLSIDKHLFIGTVIGTGLGNQPGVPLGTGDITGQKHYAASLADTILDASTVIRRDTHDSPKLHVFADALDIVGGDWPQISVWTAALARAFHVDESGNTYLGDGAAANSPEARWKTTAGTAFMRLVGSALKFQDVYTAAEIPMSAASPDNALEAPLPQSVLGAINSSRRVLAATHDDVVVSGGAIGYPGGLQISIGALTVLVNGAYKASLSIANFNLTDNATNFIYWNNSAPTVVAEAATIAAMPADSIVLYRTTTLAGAITNAVDLRLLTAHAEQRTDILVGPLVRGAHFATLAEAMDFVSLWGLPGSATTRSWRIQVIGDTTETTASNVVADGLEVVGHRGASISWAFNDAIFNLNGYDNLKFSGLRFIFTDNSDDATGLNRVPFKCIGGAVSRDVVIENCSLTRSGASAAHAFIHCDAAGDGLVRSVIRDCYINGSSDFGIHLLDGTDTLIQHCRIDYVAPFAGTSQFFGGDGIYTTSSAQLVVDACRLASWVRHGIHLYGAGLCEIAHCSVQTTGGNGIVFDNGADSNRIHHSWVTGVGTLAGGGGTAIGIHIKAGVKIHASNCYATVDAAAGTQYGIRIEATPATDFAIVSHNQTNTYTLNNANGANTTVTDNRDD